MAYEEPMNPPRVKRQIDPKAHTRPAPVIKDKKQRVTQSGGKEKYYNQ